MVSDCYVKHDREDVIKRPVETFEQKLDLLRIQSLIKYANVNFDEIKTPQPSSIIKKIWWYIFKNDIYTTNKRNYEILSNSYSKGQLSKINFNQREEYQYL